MCVKCLAQSLHTLHDHPAEEAHMGTPGRPGVSGGGEDRVTRRGLRTSAHATRQLSLSTYSNSLVQQFFTPGAILPPPPRDNGQRLETSVVAPA